MSTLIVLDDNHTKKKPKPKDLTHVSGCKPCKICFGN